MRKVLTFILLSLIFGSCTPLFTQYFLTDTEIVRLPPMEQEKRACSSWENYTTDDDHLNHLPLRTVKINLHFMYAKDSTGNLPEKEARQWGKDIIYTSNLMWKENLPAKLPEGNNIPVLPTRIRYKLTGKDKSDDGIYFHYDDNCCFSIKSGKNSTLYNRDMFNAFGIQKDTVLNIFMSPIHPDSVSSKTYKEHKGGVALGRFIKMMYPYNPKKKIEPWRISNVLNHETGHIFGLVHAWGYNDGCDDTPRHSLDVKSSNMMDYNSGQRSITPCQLGKMHRKMSRLKSPQRKFIREDWCQLDTSKNVRITDSIAWLGERDMVANIYIEPGGVLQVGCRLSMPRNSVISVAPGGKLILGQNARLHNDCGDRWQGIEIRKKGDLKGEVVFRGEPKIENAMNPL